MEGQDGWQVVQVVADDTETERRLRSTWSPPAGALSLLRDETCPLCHVHCCCSHCCSHLLGFDSFDLDSLQRQRLNLSPLSLSRQCERLPQKRLSVAVVGEGIVSRGHLLRRSRAPELCGLDFGTMWSRLNFLLQALHIQEGTCC